VPLLTRPAPLLLNSTRPSAVAGRYAAAANGTPPRRYVLHGTPVHLSGAWELLDPHVDAWLAPFGLDSDEAKLPGGHGTLPVTGQLRRYDQREVMRHLSPNAVRLSSAGRDTTDLTELYQEGERFWLVDDRWGMAEMNLLKGSWRSWLLPKPTLDPARCAEMALMWPMAQVLRGRGLTLLPAVSVARDGWGVLILSPIGLEAELASLVKAGYRILGQQWSCLKEKGAAVELLHLPGRVERSRVPALTASTEDEWVDLEGEFCGSSESSARCEAVVIIEPARRAVTRSTSLTDTAALDVLRRGWPMAELHRNRRHLVTRLAMGCPCSSVELARRPDDLLTLLSRMQARAMGAARSEQRTSTDAPALYGSRRFVSSLVKV
jgi:hypothetical protein